MRKIICYFESETQCEAAVSALKSAGIDTNAAKIITDATKSSAPTKTKECVTIGSAAPIALPQDHASTPSEPDTLYAQAPIATLLIRGDLFTFHDDGDTPCGSFAVEVTGTDETLDLARDILLNLF